MSATRAAPVLELPKKPNFMVVEGRTYFLDEVKLSPADLLGECTKFYEDSLEVLKEQVSSHVSQEAQNDLEVQVARIERHLSAGIVVIPDHLRSRHTVLMYDDNKVHETRIIMFKPNRMTVTMQRVISFVDWINREITRKDAERFTKFVEWAKPLIDHYMGLSRDMSGIKVDIRFDQELIYHALVVAYNAEVSNVYVAPDNLHPHAHPGGRLCTGNASPREFWDDPGFADNFNSLNPHSWANSTTICAREHKNLLKNQYFVSGTVRGEEVGVWRV